MRSRPRPEFELDSTVKAYVRAARLQGRGSTDRGVRGIVAPMTRLHRSTRAALFAATLFLSTACANIEIQRDTATSGRFESTGFAFTLFSIDLPRPAINIARDNASDARLTNLKTTDVYRWPDLGWWDWLLDIVGWRYVSVKGTWGFAGESSSPTPAPTPAPAQ